VDYRFTHPDLYHGLELACRYRLAQAAAGCPLLGKPDIPAHSREGRFLTDGVEKGVVIIGES
jgi:hypothetical protein